MTQRLHLRQIARDRSMTATHEAGHVVVARHLGLDADGWIMPTENRGPRDSYWVGQTRWHGVYRPSGAATAAEKRLIAVAGFVAEMIWRGRGEADAEEILMMLGFPDAMSASDWDQAGVDPGEINDELGAAA